MIYRELKKLLKYRAVIFFVFFFLLIVSAMNVSVMLDPDVISSKKSFDNFKPINIKELGDDSLSQGFSLPSSFEVGFLQARDKYIKDEIVNMDKKLKLPMISQEEKALLSIERNSLADIEGMDLKVSHTAYFYNYINNISYAGFLFLCLLIFVFYYIFYQDIENSLISLYRTYSLSLKKLYIYKFSAFLIFSLFILFVWGLVDYIFLIISGTDPGLFIQNIKGFYLAPLKLNLFEYMALSIGLIYLTLIFLLLLFSLILFLLKRVGLALAGLFAFILLEFNMYNDIALGSSKEIFKLFNIFSLFERPFDKILPAKIFFRGQVEFVVLGGFAVLLVGLFILSCLLYGKGISLKSRFGRVFKGLRTKNIFVNETYNILLGSKGIVILALLAVFSYAAYEDFYYVRPDNYHSLSVEKREYYGQIDDKLFSKLEKNFKEAENYSNRGYELLEKEVKSDEEKAELIAISPFFGKYQDLGIIREEIILARANGASFYVDTESTDFLHSVKRNYNFYKDTFIGLGLIGLMASLYISANFNSKIDVLYGTMLRIKRRNAVRLMLLYMVALAIFAILIWTHICKLNKGFYYRVFDIAINNLFPISSTMDYRLFLGLTIFSYVLFIFTFVNISYYIACRNSVINSFIISLFISILLMLGFVVLPGFSPLSIIRYEIFDRIYVYIAYVLVYIGINIWVLKRIFK